MSEPVLSPDDEIVRKAAELMLLCGVRTVKNGRITLHLDGEGLVQDVEVNFKRKLRRAAPRPASVAPLRATG